MTAIGAETRIVRKQGVLSSEIGDELVLMSIERGEYYGFDPIAAVIWRRLAEPVTVGGLVDGLVAEYDGDPAIIAADVQTLLEKLAEKDLLDLTA